MFASLTDAFGLRFLKGLMVSILGFDGFDTSRFSGLLNPRVLVLISLLAVWVISSTTAETLFFDDFEDGKISKDFELDAPQGNPGKPEWVEKDGVLSQTSDQQGDPAYAVIVDQKYPPVLTIQAKVRIDTWKNGDTARGGVGVRVDLKTGYGYSWLFHNNKSNAQFLHDFIVWGQSATYKFDIEKWYWFQLHVDEETLHGKIWADGEDEPTKWLLEQDVVTLNPPIQEEGYPALNGGTSPHGGLVTVSFDDAHVWDEGGPTYAVNPQEKLATTWSKIKQG